MQSEEIIFIILMISTGILSIVAVLLIILKLAGDKVSKERLLRQEMALKHQKSALKYSIQGQEKERQRLSSELHDGILSKLNIVNLKIDVLKKEVNLENQFDMLKHILTETIEETRRISYDLMPVTLQNFGLTTALEELKEIYSKSGINILFKSKGSTQLSKDHAVHLYRIIQELINNSIKHAQCSRISFSFQNDDTFLILNYTDNGIGNKESFNFGKGLGLRNIESRVTVLNGTISLFNASPGLGFKCKIPIND